MKNYLARCIIIRCFIWCFLAAVLMIDPNDKTTNLEKRGTKRSLQEAIAPLEQLIANTIPFQLANPFVHAAYTGDLARVARWLRLAPQLINAFDALGDTALIAAADGGHLPIIRRLLAQPGIEVQLQNDEGYTALMAAVNKKNVAIIDELLRVNPQSQINLQNKLGWTALMMAVTQGFTTVTKRLLIVPGIDINLKCHDNERESEGFTALMMAVRAGLPVLVLELLLAGADRTLKNDAGETALDIARIPNLIEDPGIAQAVIQILTAPLNTAWRIR